jgi:hypothetical protein
MHRIGRVYLVIANSLNDLWDIENQRFWFRAVQNTSRVLNGVDIGDMIQTNTGEIRQGSNRVDRCPGENKSCLEERRTLQS